MKLSRSILLSLVLLIVLGLFSYSLWYQWKGNQETAYERMKSHRPIAEFNHGKGVRTITISPSEPHYIVSAGEGNDIKVWNRDNPDKPFKVLTNHPIDENDSSNSISSVFFNSSGDLLISKNYWMLAFWDVSTMELITSYSIPSSIGTVSPNDNLLATDYMVTQIWDFSSPMNLNKLYTLPDREYDNLFVSAIFSYNGKWYAKGGTIKNTSTNKNEEKVFIWNLNTRKLHKTIGREFSMNSSSNSVAVVSDQGIKEYDLGLGTDNDRIRTISFSPDNRFFAIGSNSGFTIWSIPDWKIYHHSNVYTIDIAFSPNGSVFALSSLRGISLWSINEMKPIALLKGNSIFMVYNKILFSRDGKLLVGGGYDGMVNLWDMETIE